MTKRTNRENAARLLDILDRHHNEKHLNEKNCQHNPKDLFDQRYLQKECTNLPTYFTSKFKISPKRRIGMTEAK